MTAADRPTKKQSELLDYIEKFIAEKGYGPSYREIMVGCNYNSVATVALHVNNLVRKGRLIKKDRSARSLEVAGSTASEGSSIKSNQIKPAEEKWLVEHVEYRFAQAETGHPSDNEIDDLHVLVGALRVLGLEGAATSFMPRLAALKKQ